MPGTATQRNTKSPSGSGRRNGGRPARLSAVSALGQSHTRVAGTNGHHNGTGATVSVSAHAVRPATHARNGHAASTPRLLPASPLLAPETRIEPAADLRVWREALFGLDWVSLRTSGVYYGFGVPHGHGEPVVVVPGFLGTDRYLMEMFYWLQRVGYTPYYSGIGRNTDCPDLLTERLARTVRRAHRETGQRVSLVGHSLGGTLSRVVANQHPRMVGRVITLGSPLTFARVHPLVLAAARRVKHRIDEEHQAEGRPRPATCYTDGCRCSFVSSVMQGPPPSVLTSSIYTKSDGIVDWNCCTDGDNERNIEVKGTHFGLAFNPQVYREVAGLLVEPLKRPARQPRRSTGREARCRTG